MKRVCIIFAMFLCVLMMHAKSFAWVCAIEWTEKDPSWVFVYEDVKLLQDGTYRVFVKHDFPNEKKMKKAKQTWLISSDFDRIKILNNVMYEADGKLLDSQEYPYGYDWEFVMPETTAECIVITAKEILLKK